MRKYSLFVFLYLPSVLGYCEALIPVSYWIERNTWKNNILDNYVVERIREISLIQCAGSCKTNPSCVSFFYAKSSKFCQLNAIDLENPGPKFVHLSSNFGTKYYRWNYSTTETTSTLSTVPPSTSEPCAGFEYSSTVGKYYTYLRSPVERFDDALPECRKVGGRLAQLKTQATIDAAKTIIQNIGAVKNDDLNNIAFWLAARYDSVQKQFRWIHDKKVISTKSPLWYTGQPEMLKRGAKNTECVVLIPAYFYTLDDFTCLITDGTMMYPLCECT